MELNDIKKMALESAKNLEIQWDVLESDPLYTKQFERVLQESQVMMPDLEQVYMHLREGKSVLNPDETSSISYEEREKYMQIFEDQLFAGYQLQDLWERYTLIKSITEMETL